MASPVVAATGSAALNVASFAHPITLPAGIVAGNFLVVVWGKNGGAAANAPFVDQGASGKNWSQFAQQYTLNRGNLTVFWKVAEGGDTLTLGTNGSTQSSHMSFRITGGGGALWLASTDAAAATNADPPACTTTVAAQDLLSIAVAVLAGAVVATVAPAGYGSLLTQLGGALNVSISSATKALTAATTENPGAFTNASAASGTGTILVASTAITVNARETQEAVEALSTVSPNAVMTQEAVEVLSNNALMAVMTQEAVEVLSSNDGSTRSRRIIIIGT